MIVAVDIETHDPHLKDFGDGAIRKDGKILGVGMYCEEDLKYNGYFDPRSEIVRDVMGDGGITKVFHNAVYDLSWLCLGYDIPFAGRIEDTMTREQLLDAYADQYGLDSCAARRGLAGKNYTETIDFWWFNNGGKGKAVEHLSEIPADVVRRYCIQDCKVTYELFQKQQPLLVAENLEFANNIEVELYPLLMEMKKNGIKVDNKAREALSNQLETVLQDHWRVMHEQFPWFDSLTAPTQLKRIWTELGIPFHYTENGNPSFAHDVLEFCDHPVAQSIMTMRGLNTMLTRFVDGAIQDYKYKGHIHPTFYPALRDEGGTITGRFSCRGPNLQNIPAREEKFGNEIRSLFIPEEEHLLLAFDYSQIEYRLFLNYATGDGAEEARQRFIANPNTDYHQMVMEMMGWQSLGKEGRHLTKNLNFTCITPESFIATKRGYIRAWTLKEGDKLTLGSGGWRAFIGRKKQYEFTLSNGQQFCVTMDHPFEHAGAKDIQEGDVFPIVPCSVWGDYQEFSLRPTKTWNRHLYIRVDEDWAYMLGVWLGDGCLHKNNSAWASISFCTPPENTQLLKAILEPLHTTTWRYSDKWEVWSTCSRPLAEWFEEHLGHAKEKHVPDFMYCSPRSVVISFMCGLLDSDGTIYNDRPQIINTNENIMRGIARLAAMLGWSAHWGQENYDSMGCQGVLYRLRFHKNDLLNKELQGVVRQGDWSAKRDTRGIQPVKVVSKVEVGEQDTWCMSVDPPHWYEAECCKNHNSIYGLGVRSFATKFKKNLQGGALERGLTCEQYAQLRMDEYFRTIPFVRPTMRAIQNKGQVRGYVRTPSGRRQRMPKDNKAYKLVNYLCQGGAADVLKKGLVDAWKAGVFNTLKMHATVHDENVASMPKTKEGVEAAEMFHECMEKAYNLKVPVKSSYEAGEDWGHCTEEGWNDGRAAIN